MKKTLFLLAALATASFVSCEKVQTDDLMGTEIKTSDYESAQEVDLGLSVIWAGFNYGAEKPIEKGNGSLFGAEVSKDAVWSDGWRVPTIAEWEELNACSSKIVHEGKRNAILFTGKNGKKILLPFAGVTAGPAATQHDLCDNVWMRYWTADEWETDATKYGVTMVSRKDSKLMTEPQEKMVAASIRLVKDKN